MTVNTNDLVTTVAYMIGVKKDIIEQYYGEDCRALIDELYENQNATIIRYLCSIRTTVSFLLICLKAIRNKKSQYHRMVQ